MDETFGTNSLSRTTFDGTRATTADAEDATFGVSVKRYDANGNAVTIDDELSLGKKFFHCVEGKQA